MPGDLIREIDAVHIIADHTGDQFDGGGSPARISVECTSCQRCQAIGNAAEVGFFPQHAKRGGGGCVRREGVAPGRGEHDAHTPGKDVGGGPGPFAAQLLRCHPGDGPDDVTGLGVLGCVDDMGDSEVDDLRAIPGQQDVRRFQITMHKPGPVDGDESVCQAGGEVDQCGAAEPAAFGHGRGKAHTVDVLGRHPRAFRVDVGVTHLGHIVPADPARRRDLAAEPFPEVRVTEQLRADDLHRHWVAILVKAEIDGAHPAGAQSSLEPVPPDFSGISVGQRRQHARSSPTTRTPLGDHATEPGGVCDCGRINFLEQVTTRSQNTNV